MLLFFLLLLVLLMRNFAPIPVMDTVSIVASCYLPTVLVFLHDMRTVVMMTMMRNTGP